MKIYIRGGHSEDIRGASGYLDEVNEDRKITAKVAEYLKLAGNEVYNVTPGKSKTRGMDLSVPVKKANVDKADYFVSIHLNAGGGHGTEVLYKSDSEKIFADRIVNKLALLGFTNRGSKKDVRGLYEFNATKMDNNIIEVCFVDCQSDADLYHKLGVDNIAKAIAEGIIGQAIVQPKPAAPVYPKIALSMNSIGPAVRLVQSKLKITQDGVFGKKTKDAVVAFQKLKGLLPDGVVGPKTWEVLFS